MRRAVAYALASLSVLAAGCAGLPEWMNLSWLGQRPAAMSPQAAMAAADVALAAPGRPDTDRARDSARKARETLAFFQVAPGASVFELEAGGGYWTELLSAAVGANGRVVMQNPPGFIALVKQQIDARFTPGRLGNVRKSASAFDALDAPNGSIDLVTWVQGPHDLFFKPDGPSLGDPQKSFAEIARILKPGGALVVVDHSAQAGAPSSSGNDLHRIDPAIVVAMAKAVGLQEEARADFLANPDDARDKIVFDPAIRGRTDQFVIRFRKAR